MESFGSESLWDGGVYCCSKSREKKKEKEKRGNDASD
jgi:hypothetical protein